MARHIVIDFFNISNSLKAVVAEREPTAHPLAVRINVENLCQVVEAGDANGIKAFAGSELAKMEAVYARARALGYATYQLQRVVLEDGKTAEQGVDEILHLVIANAILDFAEPQTLVIVSGDGRESHYGTSFVGQAERALRFGWQVEVWSWRHSMTTRYDPFVSTYPDALNFRHLDEHYEQVTFTKAALSDDTTGGPHGQRLAREARPLVGSLGEKIREAQKRDTTRRP